MQIDYTHGVIDHTKYPISISCTQPGMPTEAKWDEPRVLERVKQNGYELILFKPGLIPFDTDWNKGGVKTYTSNLNPRVEIVSKYGVAPKKVPLSVKYTFRVPKCDNYYAVIFQLMDREEDGKTPLPIFHFIVRDNKLWCRWAEIVNGKRGNLVYEDLGPMVFDSVYRLEMHAFLSDKGGYMTVYNHGAKIWEKKNYASASAFAGKPLLSYGVYGKPGIDMRLHVFKVSCDYLKTQNEPVKSTFLKISPCEEKV